MSKKTLGVIPARGGSKRVPNKNIREVGEKPLIAHTIQQAEEAESLDHFAVSTEDEEIRAAAEEWGANVPFERPEELATDTATSDEVVFHALEWFRSAGWSFDYVCLLPVTTPFRSVDDINSALRKLRKSDADTIVSVCEYDIPPFWSVDIVDGRIEPHFEQNPWKETQSQEYPDLLRPNGALFAASTSQFMETKSFYTDNTAGYKMPRKRSLDIDEPFDLELARALMKWRNQ
jgi:CMP-N-acetylneuraminic acid synthetase